MTPPTHNVAIATVLLAVALVGYVILGLLGYTTAAEYVGWRVLAPIPLWYTIAIAAGIAEATRRNR